MVTPLDPLGRRVVSIVNYDSFWVDPDIADKYMDLVRYVQDRYELDLKAFFEQNHPQSLQEITAVMLETEPLLVFRFRQVRM